MLLSKLCLPFLTKCYLVGVFIAKGDVGVGTIVGSAVFNILFVIGLCGILAGQVTIDVLEVWRFEEKYGRFVRVDALRQIVTRNVEWTLAIRTLGVRNDFLKDQL